MKIKDIFKKKKYLTCLCYCKRCDAVWYEKKKSCPQCGDVVRGMCISSTGCFCVNDILNLKKMINENT